MNEELTAAQDSCRFVSSFIIHTSSFVFWVIPRAGQRRDFPLGQLGRIGSTLHDTDKAACKIGWQWFNHNST